MSCNDGVDRISQLPDDIIVHVLSYLTLRDSARTSVLSTRLCDLWRYIPTLDLYDKRSNNRTFVRESSWYDEEVKFIQRVNKIVEKHKAHSLKKLHLVCNLDKSSHAAITKWLEFAFSKRVEEMRLTFQDIVEGNAVVLGELLRIMRPNTSLLESSSLKSLYMGNLMVSGEDIKLILRDCRLLERLAIDKVVFTSDIEVCGLVLKHLEIGFCSGGKSINISAPNLTYLHIGIRYERNLWLVENVPKLVEVYFGSCRANSMQDFCFVSQLQILTIATFCPLDFLAKEISTMPKLMELNIECYFGFPKYLLPTLTSLVRASPLLQTFNLEFWRNNEEDMEVGNVETFKHHHLRVFKFSRFEVEDVDHMELVSFILHNCVALRKLIIEVGEVYYFSPDIERANREADVEKIKLVLQSSLPPYVQLQVISNCY